MAPRKPADAVDAGGRSRLRCGDLPRDHRCLHATATFAGSRSGFLAVPALFPALSEQNGVPRSGSGCPASDSTRRMFKDSAADLRRYWWPNACATSAGKHLLGMTFTRPARPAPLLAAWVIFRWMVFERPGASLLLHIIASGGGFPPKAVCQDVIGLTLRQNLGGVLHFEHVRLRVPDLAGFVRRSRRQLDIRSCSRFSAATGGIFGNRAR